MRIRKGRGVTETAKTKDFDPKACVQAKKQGILKRQMTKSVRFLDFVEVIPYFCASVNGGQIKQNKQGAEKAWKKNGFGSKRMKKLGPDLGFSDSGLGRILAKPEDLSSGDGVDSWAMTFVKARSGNCVWRLGSGRVKSLDRCRSNSFLDPCRSNISLNSPPCRGPEPIFSYGLDHQEEESCSQSIDSENKICHPGAVFNPASSFSPKSQIRSSLNSEKGMQNREATEDFGGLILLAEAATDLIRQEKEDRNGADLTKRGFFIHGGCGFSQKTVSRRIRKNVANAQVRQEGIASSDPSGMQTGQGSGRIFLGSKRGRTPILPGKFHDSVLCPWKKKKSKCSQLASEAKIASISDRKISAGV